MFAESDTIGLVDDLFRETGIHGTIWIPSTFGSMCETKTNVYEM